MLEHLPEGVGHALRNQRAGLEKIAFNLIGPGPGTAQIAVTSTAFVDHGPIPALYTADGEGLSPPLQWQGVPANAVTLAFIVEDVDSPTPRPLVHAIVVDLPVTDGSLDVGALKSPDHDAQGVHAGRNSVFRAGWLPPDPPPGHGVHRYAFQVFALTGGEPFSAKPGRDELLDELRTRTVASGCLIGTYERPDGTVRVDAAEPVPVPITRDPLVG